MQYILGVDLSSQPCEITVSCVNGEHVEVLERTTAALPLLNDRKLLCNSDLRPFLQKKNDDQLPGELATDTQDTSKEEQLRSAVLEAVTALREALGSLRQEWTASTVIIPAHDHIALNLNLPFGDAKNLGKIVDLEVQDVLPFEINEFLVQYSTVGIFEAGTGITGAEEEGKTAPFDVHVGVIPRSFVRNLLELCKASGLEPNILTVPSSAIAAVYHLGKDFFKANSAVIFNRGEEYSMAIFINGEVRVERALLASNIIPAQLEGRREDDIKHIFTALKLMIASTERRYGTRIESVYLLGRDVKGSNLQQLFGRPLEGVQFRDVLKTSDPQVSIAALGAIFAKDETTLSPLSNFRTREFSFTPRFGEFLRALLGARRYMITATLALLIGIASIYGIRAYTITRTKNALLEQIKMVLPNFESSDEDLRMALATAEKKLSDELGVLSSPAKVSPLDALLEIMKLFPEGAGVILTSIKVNGTRVTITGNVPSISASESVSKALKVSKDFFSRVEPPRTSPSGTKFNFTIEATLAL